MKRNVARLAMVSCIVLFGGVGTPGNSLWAQGGAPNPMNGAVPPVFTAMLPILIVMYLAVVVLMIAGMWKIYTKAGKPGWASLIPFYNIIVLCEIVGRPIWWFLLLIIPCVGLVFAIILYIDLAKSFGKDPAWVLGFILLPFVFFPLLGFGDARYLGPIAQL